MLYQIHDARKVVVSKFRIIQPLRYIAQINLTQGFWESVADRVDF